MLENLTPNQISRLFDIFPLPWSTDYRTPNDVLDHDGRIIISCPSPALATAISWSVTQIYYTSPEDDSMEDDQPFFTYTSHNGVLTINEGFNGWYLTHNPSQTTIGMGDGTNGLNNWKSAGAIPIWIEASESELRDAYFPDQSTDHQQE